MDPVYILMNPNPDPVLLPSGGGVQEATWKTADKAVIVQRALIVDDSRAYRLVMKNYLSELGYDPVESQDGHDALEKMRGGLKVAVALIDWEMPRMTGVELIRALRADSQWDHLPILMVTTRSSADCVIEAIASGANEFIMKPFTKEVLAAKLELAQYICEGD